MASFEQSLSLPVTELEPVAKPAALSSSAAKTGVDIPGRRAELASVPSFGALFRDHSRFVLALLRRLGVSQADLEDVAQEVFLAIHAQLGSFESRSSLKTWLCSVCRNKACDHIRKIGRRRRLMAKSGFAEDATPRDPQDELLHKERESLLHRELAKLPTEQREVFVLFEVEELSMKEVAEVIGCPLDTAYTRHRVARQRIQAAFERVGKARGGV